MEKVIIKNGELLQVEFNENLKAEVTTIVAVEDFEKCYAHEVEMHPELTVGGFMQALKPYFGKIDPQFIAYSHGYFMQHYYDQMSKPREYDNDDIAIVEFYWHAELYEHDDLEKGRPVSELSIHVDYHGVSKDKTYYGFGLSPINNWQHYPLALNETFVIRSFKAPYTDILKSEKKFSFHELLRTFIYELTWHGYTDTIDELSKHMKSIGEKIEAGTADLVPLDLDALQLNHLETELEQALTEQNFEWAMRVRDKISEIKNKL